MQEERKEDLCLLKPQMCWYLRCLLMCSGHNRKSCDTWECKCSLFPPPGGAKLDGALGVYVTDGVTLWVGLGLTRPVRAHAVLLLTEQGGGLPRPAVWAVRGWGLLGLEGEGGGLRRWGIVGTCRHARRRRGGLGERGVVTGRVRSLRHRLAGSVGGGRGHLGNGGAAAHWKSVWNLPPRRRRGQQQGVAGPRWRHGQQRHGRV